MALAIDGHVTGSWVSGSSFTVTGLTTANAGDVIVALIATKSSSLVTVSSLSTPGVVWNGATRKKLTWSSTDDLELWYGTAIGTLSSVTTTINLSGTPSAQARASVFGVSGADTSTITDSNASLPATNTGSSSVPTVTGVSTSNAKDMIIAGMALAGATTETAGTGFTLIDALNASGLSIATEQEVVSATQSSVSVAFGTSVTTWAMIVDAIKASTITNIPNQIINNNQAVARAANW